MNCTNVKDKLSALLDNELSASESTAVKAHIIRCPQCRAQRESMENMGSLLRALPPVTADPDFEFKVYAGIRRQASPVHRTWSSRWRLIMAPMAALFIGIVIGSFQFSQPGDVPVMISEKNSVSETGMSPDTAKAMDLVAASPIIPTEDGIRSYAMDRYVSPIIRDVDVIPDTDSGTPANTRYDSPHRNPNDNPPRYVLDNVPLRAGYERTVY